MRGNSVSYLFTDLYRCLLACPALRKLCELVTAYVREILKSTAPDLAGTIAVYRAGYRHVKYMGSCLRNVHVMAAGRGMAVRCSMQHGRPLHAPYSKSLPTLAHPASPSCAALPSGGR